MAFPAAAVVYMIWGVPEKAQALYELRALASRPATKPAACAVAV